MAGGLNERSKKDFTYDDGARKRHRLELPALQLMVQEAEMCNILLASQTVGEQELAETRTDYPNHSDRHRE
jgi:hypothetical protein